MCVCPRAQTADSVVPVNLAKLFGPSLQLQSLQPASLSMVEKQGSPSAPSLLPLPSLHIAAFYAKIQG